MFLTNVLNLAHMFVKFDFHPRIHENKRETPHPPPVFPTHNRGTTEPNLTGIFVEEEQWQTTQH